MEPTHLSSQHDALDPSATPKYKQLLPLRVYQWCLNQEGLVVCVGWVKSFRLAVEIAIVGC